MHQERWLPTAIKPEEEDEEAEEEEEEVMVVKKKREKSVFTKTLSEFEST